MKTLWTRRAKPHSMSNAGGRYLVQNGDHISTIADDLSQLGAEIIPFQVSNSYVGGSVQTPT